MGSLLLPDTRRGSDDAIQGAGNETINLFVLVPCGAAEPADRHVARRGGRGTAGSPCASCEARVCRLGSRAVSFSAALGAVSPPCRARVEAQLGAWRGGSDGWVQVATNVEHETALPIPDFTSLLEAFGQALLAGAIAADAWQTACRGHQFRGARMPVSAVPGVLGRAIAFKYYADYMFTASNQQLTAGRAESILQQYAEQAPLPARVDRLLRQTLVGRHVVWATFCEATPGMNPFDVLSRATRDIITAFGLGDALPSEPLVLIAYQSNVPSANPPIHRPTIAEAGSFAYYRPWHDPAHPHGYTSPLAPNPGGLAGQPEVVHPQILGAGLLLPYHLSTR